MDLDEQQRQVAETLLGPVCVLAGAGTGKTRAITHRIAHGVASGAYSPNRVMALTFTARAAGELRSRLRALGAGGVAARTFHAAALSQLNYFWPQVAGGSLPKVLEGKGRLLAQAAETLGLKLDTATLRDTAAEIEWRKVSALTPEQYRRAAASRALPNALDADRATELQLAYERLKDERHQLDFEDVLLVMAGMLESEARVAEQVREQYRFFVVDEYQDVSAIQQRLLALWLGDRDDVCVVGDASQTIYSFAGASSDHLLRFAAEHDGAAVIRLERNYRSTPAILDTANRLMRSRAGALELLPAADPAQRGPEPVVVAHPNDRAEARAVADAVASRIGAGADPADIAVLYRVNVQSAPLEQALTDAGVPFQLRGATRFFERREVREAMMLLRGAAVNVPPGEPLFKSVSDVLRGVGWTQSPPANAGSVRARWESLDALMTLAEQAPAGSTLRRFVDDLFDRQQSQHEPTVSAVTLATLHSAKGLEWDHVFLVGASEGYLPIVYAQGLEAVDEERRLLYVGITRARRSLQLTWAEEGAHARGRRQPSRFLAELAPSRGSRGAAGARTR